MRIWSLHPCYLDAKGLVALWRETLLAQNVLLGKTKGYKNHPQLDRFKQQADPAAAIGSYLHGVYEEAVQRGYNFDQSKIVKTLKKPKTLPVTDGQMAYEFDHLKRKLEIRDPDKYLQVQSLKAAKPHALFHTVKGDVEDWERM